MKLTYTPMVKEPFVLELSMEELGSIRFHLSEAIEKPASKSLYFKTSAEISKDKGDKDAAYSQKIYESSVRDLKEIQKIKDDLEHSIKTLKWPI
jgi:hypothetical protein